MRILILDTYYLPFLSSFYSRHQQASKASYDEQWGLIISECFGTSDFYSSNLQQLGHEATEVITNCEPMQRQWAKEQGIHLEADRGWALTTRKGIIPWISRPHNLDWSYKVLAAQVKAYRPDVLYVQDMNSLSASFLHEIKPGVRLIVGQIACPIVPGSDFSEYDLILSSFPHFVERFRSDGLASEYFNLGFEPKVLDRLSSGTHHDVVFVGSLSPDHARRLKLLETVARSHSLEVWGHKTGPFERNSPLRDKYHGEAWALEMYQILHDADVVLNHHIDLAASYANNMRLFETSGTGSMLLTDWKVNLHELFEPGKEVIAYRTPEECNELIEYYLEHKEERKAVAAAGQRRTLRDHTYYHRMQQLTSILEQRL